MSDFKGRHTVPTPCSNCPFRTDVPRYLRPERAQEIATSMLGDQSDFMCHKTVDYDDNSEGTVGPRARTCAGSMILLEKEGKPTQSMRIAERVGLYNPESLDMDAPVYDTVNEWVRSYRSDEGEDETPHCDIVGPNCIDPAGFLLGGTAVENMEPGQATHTCAICGKSACEECISETDEGETICESCMDEQGEDY